MTISWTHGELFWENSQDKSSSNSSSAPQPSGTPGYTQAKDALQDAEEASRAAFLTRGPVPTLRSLRVCLGVQRNQITKYLQFSSTTTSLSLEAARSFRMQLWRHSVKWFQSTSMTGCSLDGIDVMFRHMLLSDCVSSCGVSSCKPQPLYLRRIQSVSFVAGHAIDSASSTSRFRSTGA